ncbi:MAG: hypothetical protein C5B52_11075 [Bacteroidetes bacterium]|nr:MAG: hypothetical protein C5B52_11075 [Bacteroidota bacterium]
MEYQIYSKHDFAMLQNYVNFLPSNLRHLRKKKNLRQDEMQNILGISRTTWSNYETGVSEPSVGSLLKISQFFGIKLDSLVLDNLNGGEKPLERMGKKSSLKRIVYSANEDIASMVMDPQVGFAYVLKELQKLRQDIDAIILESKMK